MTEGEEMLGQIDALRRHLREVHGIRGRDLNQALQRSKRFLPRRVRKAGLHLARAEPLLGHPKLERMVDFASLQAAHRTVEDHLNSVDKGDLRRGRLLGIAAAAAVNVIVVAILFVLWIRWAAPL